MKLRPERIDYIAKLIIDALIKEEMILITDLESGFQTVRRIITEDLMIEEKIDDEVREILAQHGEEIDKQKIPYHQMFKAVKDKLVKDRNIIL